MQRRICEMLGVDLSALWEGPGGGGAPFTLTHFYSAQEDLLPPMRGMSAGEYFPWLQQEMLSGRIVAVSSLDDLPEAAAFDRENLRQFGVQSNLTFPLSVGGASPMGALGFNTTRAMREWPDVLVKRLQLVGQVFANALARKQTDDALRESEARVNLATESAEAGLWAFDYRTGVFWASERARTTFAYAPDEIITLANLEVRIHPDDRERVLGVIERPVHASGVIGLEYRIATAPGANDRWILSRGRPEFSPTGEPTRLMGVVIDVTEQKRAEAEMGEYRSFETLALGLSTKLIAAAPEQVDPQIEGALRDVCGALGIELAVLWQWTDTDRNRITPTHGYPPLTEAQRAQLLRQEDYPWVVGQMREGRVVALATLDDLPPEGVVDRESARLGAIRSSLVLPLLAGGAAPVGALAFNSLSRERDWPEALVRRLRLIGQVFTNALTRQAQELALCESEAVNRATFEQAAVGIADVGLDGRWLRVNDKLCAIVGYSREELLRLTFQDLTHPDDLEPNRELMMRLLGGEVRTHSVDKRYVRRDGAVVWVTVTVSLVRSPTGAALHFVSVVEDITVRKRDEEALRVSGARLASAADLAGLAFYEIDYATGAAYFDDRFRDVCGLPPDHGPGLGSVQFWLEHLHPDDRPSVDEGRARLHDGRLDQFSHEYRYCHPSRGERWIHHLARVNTRAVDGRAAKTFGVLRDVTDRRRSEEALRQSVRRD